MSDMMYDGELTEKQRRLLAILRRRRDRHWSWGLSFKVDNPLHKICQELESLGKIEGFCVSTNYNQDGIIVPEWYDWRASESA